MLISGNKRKTYKLAKDKTLFLAKKPCIDCNQDTHNNRKNMYNTRSKPRPRPDPRQRPHLNLDQARDWTKTKTNTIKNIFYCIQECLKTCLSNKNQSMLRKAKLLPNKKI